MNKVILVLIYTLVSCSLYGQEFVAGNWNTNEDNTVIETYVKDDLWYGKIVSSDHPDAKIGKDIMQGFQKKDGKWKGKIFAAKKNKLLNAEVVPFEDQLKITISAGLFKKKLTWERVD